MKASDLTPGTKVDISIVQLLENQESALTKQTTYASMIFDVRDNGILELQMPIVGTRLQTLPENIRYEFLFTLESGFYVSEGTVLSHFKRDNFYLLEVELHTELKKVQRREYYRLPCMIPTVFMVLNEEAAKQPTPQLARKYMEENVEFIVRGMGEILDISGGGARFVSSNSLSDVRLILLQFRIEFEKLGGAQEMNLIAKIIQSDKVPGDDRYMHRVQFFFKNSYERENLITYIFEQDRLIRKKERS